MKRSSLIFSFVEGNLTSFIPTFSFLVEPALAERDSKKARVLFVFFFGVSSPNRRPLPQPFLAETLETGDKNRDDD